MQTIKRCYPFGTVNPRPTIKPFQDFKGLFMYHCHNLEHEDMGIMRDFSVE